MLPGDESVVEIEADAGTDRLSLRVFGNMETGQARLIATLDNLGKGAAGAAVQNFNCIGAAWAVYPITIGWLWSRHCSFVTPPTGVDCG